MLRMEVAGRSLDARRLLDPHSSAPGDDAADFFDVLRTLNERQCYPVRAEFETVG